MELVLSESNETNPRKTFPYLDRLPRELVNRIIGKMSSPAFYRFRRTSRNNADYVRSNRHCFKIQPEFTRWMSIVFDKTFSLTKNFKFTFINGNDNREECTLNWEERFELQTRCCEEKVSICLKGTSVEDLREILPFWKKMFVFVDQISLCDVKAEAVRFLIESLTDHPPAERICWYRPSLDPQCIQMVLMAVCATRVCVRTRTFRDAYVRPVVKEWQNAVRYSFSNIVEFAFWESTERENVLEKVCEDVVYTKIWDRTMHAVSALRGLQVDDWMDWPISPQYYMVKRLVPLKAKECQQYALLAVYEDLVRFHVRLDRESFIRTLITEIKPGSDDNEINRCVELVDKEMIPW